MIHQDIIGRLRADLDDGRAPQVRYDPETTDAAAGEVAIGLGLPAAGGAGVCLNHKQTPHRSVSRYVLEADEETAERWRAAVGDPLKAAYVVEDFSPDTCLAFVVFCVRCAGAEATETVRRYVDYADRWEEGDVRTTGQPFASWGCLHNALAHSYFPRPADASAGFAACVRLVLALLARDADPARVPAIADNAEYARATGLLRREYQEYAQSLKHAQLLQLELPLAGSSRRMTVDAFIGEDRSFTGAAKAFLRTDAEHPHFRDGFTLMAVYRPDLAGTGNDMTISVDPSSGVYLKELWHRLERMEDERWGADRPSAKPRFPDISHAEEPWFHGKGTYTLLAAPKRIGGVPGSRLGWDDVVRALWDEYNPAESIVVRPDRDDGAEAEPCRLYRCEPDPASGPKSLVAARWERGDKQAMLLTPTLQRVMAACIGSADRTRIPDIDMLPPVGSFDWLELPGGFAVVHGDGVFLLDDWNREPMDIRALREEFVRLQERFRRIRTHREEIRSLVDGELGPNGLLRGRKQLLLSNRLARIKLDMRKTLLRTVPSAADYAIAAFRQSVESRWGMQSQLEELYAGLSELESILKSYSDTRSNYLIGVLTIYGFPFALIANFFGFVFEGDIHWTGIAGFVLLSFVLLGALLVWDRRSARTRTAIRGNGRGKEPSSEET
ncbi:hypothetical protein [Paenibacillus flagellatus]|uniref:Uncharacterized protein n=1 Tax=Paenibacillus flagellatus TaxID=2211139 RepID=A0A2V5K5I3_9BACL|nr:hypothetical protein [Paenibacillus flagellatus]PYI54528.1 hypothetical protein DLM86_13785 [Paenibacillus flagellatus]